MTSPRTALLFLVAALAFGCADEEPADLDSSNIVARYAGGVLTVDEVDRALIDLPQAQRPTLEQLTTEWLEDFVAELLVDRILSSEGELTGVRDDPRVQRALREMQRDVLWQDYVSRAAVEIEEPTQQELEAEFELRRSEFVRPERRMVRNIFLRRHDGESGESLRARAESLRARVTAGESFETLAKTESDSETRFRGGMIGWVERTTISPAVAEIVFELDRLQVSDPVLTREGAHLFLVESATQASSPSFESLQNRLRQDLVDARREAAIGRQVEALPDPETELFVTSIEELNKLLEDRDGGATVLRAGDYEVSLATLLTGVRTHGGARVQPAEHLEHLVHRERVFQFGRSEGWLDEPRIEQALERATAAEAARLQREQGIRRLIDEDPARLQEFFRDRESRFYSPLELELESLIVPVTTPQLRRTTMLALQRRYAESGSKGIDIHQLADQFGGSIELLGWMQANTLGLDPALSGLIAGLETGETSQPIQGAGNIQMLKVVNRREPSPQALATVLERVREAYLAERGQALYEEWRENLLEREAVEISPVALARIKTAALPSALDDDKPTASSP